MLRYPGSTHFDPDPDPKPAFWGSKLKKFTARKNIGSGFNFQSPKLNSKHIRIRNKWPDRQGSWPLKVKIPAARLELRKYFFRLYRYLMSSVLENYTNRGIEVLCVSIFLVLEPEEENFVRLNTAEAEPEKYICQQCSRGEYKQITLKLLILLFCSCFSYTDWHYSCLFRSVPIVSCAASRYGTKLFSILPVGWVSYPVPYQPAGTYRSLLFRTHTLLFNWRSFILTTSYGTVGYVIVSLDLIVPYTGTTWIY